jgi:hypothetical protein
MQKATAMMWSIIFRCWAQLRLQALPNTVFLAATLVTTPHNINAGLVATGRVHHPAVEAVMAEAEDVGAAAVADVADAVGKII